MPARLPSRPPPPTPPRTPLSLTGEVVPLELGEVLDAPEVVEVGRPPLAAHGLPVQHGRHLQSGVPHDPGARVLLPTLPLRRHTAPVPQLHRPARFTPAWTCAVRELLPPPLGCLAAFLSLARSTQPLRCSELWPSPTCLAAFLSSNSTQPSVKFLPVFLPSRLRLRRSIGSAAGGLSDGSGSAGQAVQRAAHRSAMQQGMQRPCTSGEPHSAQQGGQTGGLPGSRTSPALLPAPPVHTRLAGWLAAMPRSSPSGARYTRPISPYWDSKCRSFWGFCAGHAGPGGRRAQLR